jgi:hypothetical protein
MTNGDLETGSVVGGRVGLFLHARVDVGELVEHAPGEESADQQVGGNDGHDDGRHVGQNLEIAKDAEPKRDDDSNYPIFRSDIFGQCRNPFESAAVRSGS